MENTTTIKIYRNADYFKASDGLNDAGKTQIAGLDLFDIEGREYLFYSSDIYYAMQTADLIAQRLNCDDAKINLQLHDVLYYQRLSGARKTDDQLVINTCTELIYPFCQGNVDTQNTVVIAIASVTVIKAMIDEVFGESKNRTKLDSLACLTANILAGSTNVQFKFNGVEKNYDIKEKVLFSID